MVDNIGENLYNYKKLPRIANIKKWAIEFYPFIHSIINLSFTHCFPLALTLGFHVSNPKKASEPLMGVLSHAQSIKERQRNILENYWGRKTN